jgi:hypothetical protein
LNNFFKKYSVKLPKIKMTVKKTIISIKIVKGSMKKNSIPVCKTYTHLATVFITSELYVISDKFIDEFGGMT